MRSPFTWLKITAVLQILTAMAHSISFFVTPVAANETEQQLLNLMHNYLMDMGAGFQRTMSEVTTALSASFAILYLFAGVLNIYLVRKKISMEILKGLLSINLLFFGVAFAIMVRYTFLPPITLTGLVFVLLCISWIVARKSN